MLENSFSASELTRLLQTPLGSQILGVEIAADVYAKNGFRFLVTPAFADHDLYQAESQKFRNIFKLDRKSALNLAIKTGYESHVHLDDVIGCLSKLDDPRHRIVCELFWPHVSDGIFDRIKQDQHICSSGVLQALATNAGAPKNGVGKHALAIAHHNLAISHELAFASGEESWNGEHWQNALSFWAELLELDSFWKYLDSRAESFDDPRLNAEDVQLLRAQLPGLLLEFNALFARAYAKANQTAASSRHIALIKSSRLPESAKHDILNSLVQSLTAARLEPLIHRVNSEVLEKKGRQSRKKIDKVCTPVLQETLAIRDYLLDELKFSPQMVELTEFDRLCELIVKVLDNKINYDTDDRVRSILYSSLVTKKLLSLPLSSPVRRKFEQSLDRDADILYDEFLKGSDSKIDPTQCWFLGWEEADPDASIEFAIHKVTEVKGVSVRWQKRRILVPRSKLAAKFHKGKLSVEKLAQSRQDDKSKSIRADIERIQGECDQAITGIEEKLEKSIQQKTNALEKQLEVCNKRIASEETKHLAETEKIQSQLEKDIALEEEQLPKTCLDVENKAAGPIAEAEAEYNQLVKDTEGLRGGARLELPAAGIASMFLAGGAFIMSGSLVVSTGMQPFLFPVFGLLAGVVSGGAMGRVIRIARRRKAGLPVKRLRKKRDDEFTKLENAYQKSILELKKAADMAVNESHAQLDALNTEKADMKTKCDNSVADLRKKAESGINRLRKGAAQKIKPLQEKLETYLEPKPESKKKSFPPYKTAKSKGYKDGVEPSDYEINRLVKREIERFMNSLSYEEKNTLALLYQYLGETKTNELINGLMSLSTAERRRKLNSLNILRNFGGY